MNLKEKLKLSKKTQIDLAKFTNVSIQTVGRWCAEVTTPTEENMELINKFFEANKEN